MRKTTRFARPLQVLALAVAASLAAGTLAEAAPARKNARKITKARRPARAAKPAKATRAKAANVPAIFYDEEWEYRTATLYDKEKNIVSSVSGTAKFERDGKFRQDYYIGSIGNFFKGTYKIEGDRLRTFDDKGKPIFTFRFSLGTAPKVLVLSMLEDDGTKTVDFSLVPTEKKKQ